MVVLKETELSQILTYLAKYGSDNSLVYLQNKLFVISNEDVQQYYQMLVNVIQRRGLLKLLEVANLKKENVISKYNKKPIEFTKLSYRSAGQNTKGINSIQPNKNNNNFCNSMIVIEGLFGTKGNKKENVVVPTQANSKYHSDLKEYTSQEYIIVVNEHKQQIRFITTKKGNREYASGNTNFLGVDVNIKHNLFATSSNQTIDFDRDLLNKFIAFLKKTDLKNNKNFTKGETKLQQTYQRRIKYMLQEKCNELIKLAKANDKNHIVMEDLSQFSRSFSKSDEFQGVKYSRLIKLLHLSSLNEIVASICSKNDIQLTLIHSHYTSQACPVCGNISRDNRTSQEQFKCVICGHTCNADLNSSINIHLLGQQEVLGCSKLLQKNKLNQVWFSPKRLKKEAIKDEVENIFLTNPFQESRINLFSLI